MPQRQFIICENPNYASRLANAIEGLKIWEGKCQAVIQDLLMAKMDGEGGYCGEIHLATLPSAAQKPIL